MASATRWYTDDCAFTLRILRMSPRLRNPWYRTDKSTPITLPSTVLLHPPGNGLSAPVRRTDVCVGLVVVVLLLAPCSSPAPLPPPTPLPSLRRFAFGLTDFLLLPIILPKCFIPIVLLCATQARILFVWTIFCLRLLCDVSRSAVCSVGRFCKQIFFAAFARIACNALRQTVAKMNTPTIHGH